MSCLLLASPASATYQRKIHQKNSKGIELIFVVRNMPLRTISKRILGMLKSRTNNISPLNVHRYKKEAFWKFLLPILSSIPEIIWVINVRAIVVCGFLMKSLKKHILKIWKKTWEPFGCCLLNSTANPAHFHLNWAEFSGYVF